MPKKRSVKKRSTATTVRRKKKKRVVKKKQETLEERTVNVIGNAVRSISRGWYDSDEPDTRRSINDECGYPATESISLRNYRDMYQREGVASRVVEIFPEESWLLTPSVMEDENPKVSTQFEKDWEEINKSLQPSSRYNAEMGGSIWDYLQRVDILSGIGTYGVILLGIDDGKPLSEPVQGFEEGMPLESVGDYNLLYMRVFPEDRAAINTYDNDPSSPRYQMPVQYLLTVSNESESLNTAAGEAGVAQQTVQAHWSRIVHIADTLRSSEIFGLPRQLQVFNYLLNIRKLLGSSPEMYYKGAFPGTSFETHPQLGGDVKIDADDMRDMVENYQNGLQRYLVLAGMSANSLSSDLESPKDYLNAQIEAICIRKGIPKRIFIGSERGELASSQDAKAWDRRVSKRRNTYLSPRVIAPTIDRLILYGVLSDPENGYFIIWPDMDNLTEAERAAVAVKRTEAITKYLQGSGEALLHPLDFLIDVMGVSEKEAEGYLENVDIPEEKETADVDTEENSRQ